MVSLIRLIIMFIRLAAPIVIQAAFYTMQIIMAAVASLWVGVPTAVKRIADEWVDRAERVNFRTDLLPELHRAIQFVAFLIIVGAWVFFAHVTVWLVARIF